MEYDKKAEANKLKADGLSIKEIAEILEVHPRTVYKWCGDRKVSHTPPDIAQNIDEAIKQLEASTYSAIAILSQSTSSGNSGDGSTHLRLSRALQKIAEIRIQFGLGEKIESYNPNRTAQLDKQLHDLIYGLQ